MNLNKAFILKDGILAIAQTYFLEWLNAQQKPADHGTRFVNSAYLQFDFRPQQTLDQAFWDRNTHAFRGANIAIVDCTMVIISKNHRAFIRSKSDYCAMQGTGGFQRRDENHWGLCRSKASYSSALSK
jgi:hypothetical protein